MTNRPGRFSSTVLRVRTVAPGVSVVRFARNGMEFEPGQHLKLGLAGGDLREYSVYSAVSDDYLEVLIREVSGGLVSSQLCRSGVGSELDVQGPLGAFTLPDSATGQPFLFVATGTGIAPYHCIVRSRPEIEYQLIHGIRSCGDRFEAGHYHIKRYVSCVSRGHGGDFPGRVTDYLRRHPVSPGTQVLLCGSCDMIYEAFNILAEQGIPREDVRVETYY